MLEMVKFKSRSPYKISTELKRLKTKHFKNRHKLVSLHFFYSAGPSVLFRAEVTLLVQG